MVYSLEDYASRNELNKIIARNLIYITQLQERYGTFTEKATFCFSTAYRICRQIISSSKASIYNIPEYYSEAAFPYSKDKDQQTVMKAVTISIVLVLLEHVNEEWRKENREFTDTMRSTLNSMKLSDEAKERLGFNIRQALSIPTACVEIFNSIHSGTSYVNCVLSFEEFSFKCQNANPHTAVNSEKTVVQKHNEPAKPTPVSVTDEQLVEQLKEANEKIAELQTLVKDYESKYSQNAKDKDGNKIPVLTGKQHVILMLAVLAKFNSIPNARTDISSEMSMIAQRSESTMFDYLKESITPRECKKLALTFKTNLPVLAAIIEELPEKLQANISKKNREKRLKSD